MIHLRKNTQGICADDGICFSEWCLRNEGSEIKLNVQEATEKRPCLEPNDPLFLCSLPRSE